LYTMRDQGLVEQLSDGIYRIPPLVQRRLGDALWRNANDGDVDSLFTAFSKKILIAKSEFGAIYASNVAVVATRTGAPNIAPQYDRYLTLAMLFKTGLERYSNKEWTLAHQTLQRSMARLMTATASVDVSTQIEIARFAGLAAARCSKVQEVENSCVFLETKFAKSKRARSASAMAKFVRGFRNRLGRHWPAAINDFEEALELLDNERYVERQRAAIYTELATTYLRTSPPQFDDALRMARAAFQQKDVIHTLSAYVHTLVFFVFRSGRFKSIEFMAEYLAEIEELLQQLHVRSAANGQDFHANRLAEYQRERGTWERNFASSNQTPKAIAIPAEPFDPIELDYL
jgi:hypothetical protein